MSGRKGVFVKVKARNPLADPGRKRGAVVAVLECGHARTATRGARLWCRLCTAKAVKEATPRYTLADLRAAVAAALRKAERRAAGAKPSSPPTLKAVGP